MSRSLGRRLTRQVSAQDEGAAEGEIVGILPPVIIPSGSAAVVSATSTAAAFPYVVGAMAGGISSVSMVVASGRAGILSYLGSGGVELERLRFWIEEIQAELGGSDAPWGVNLLHAPGEEAHEAATVEMFLGLRVRRVSASAFVRPTASLVQVRLHRSPARRSGTARAVQPSLRQGLAGRDGAHLPLAAAA